MQAIGEYVKHARSLEQFGQDGLSQWQAAYDNEGIRLLGTQSFLGTALTFWDVDTCRVW